jgi:lipoprotein-releasing system ATP-binding protein
VQIRLKNVHKGYRDAGKELAVIEDLSFDFPEKGSVAVVGRSGTGKSTFLHLLGGLDRPQKGSIFFGQTDLARLNPDELSDFRGRNVGFIFQFHHLLPEFSAVENVSMPLILGGMTDRQAEEKSAAILSRMGLQGRLTHRPGQLSGGEQQRVAIARAIVNNPRVILADEPTGNLDFETGAEVQRILLEMNKELGNLMILVTHNQDLAKSMDIVLEMLPGGNLRLI